MDKSVTSKFPAGQVVTDCGPGENNIFMTAQKVPWLQQPAPE
jgi:hypothetical protein